MDGRDWASRGLAGGVRQGLSCRVKAWCGRQGKVWTVGRGELRHGEFRRSRHGEARCGELCLGKFRWCRSRFGQVWYGRLGEAWRVTVSSGRARLGRQGGARHVSVRFVQERRGGARQTGRGEARRVVIRFGDAGVLKRVNVWSGNGLAGNPLTKQ